MANNLIGKLCYPTTETGSKRSLVEDWMQFIPPTVESTKSVAQARALLLEHGISHLPVISKGRLVGIVTERALQGGRLTRVHRSLRKRIESSPDRIPVDAVMKTHVVTVAPSDALGQAAKLMRREHLKALPVVEGGHLRGIIHLADIMDAYPAAPIRSQLDTSREAGGRVRSWIFDPGQWDAGNDRSAGRGKRAARTRPSGSKNCKRAKADLRHDAKKRMSLCSTDV
jgi:CBS domain-containing protein